MHHDGQPHFALVAGETSGDLLAGLLMQGLRMRWPGLTASGIGGPRMVDQGLQAWWSSDRLAVRGYVEVLRHYRGIVRIRRELKARLLASPPSVFIGVDAPDFNLDLEEDLRASGIRTVHFVCPSIWAWRAGRVEKIKRSAGHVLCLFPFEPELLRAHGIAATYVGHPLAAVIPREPDRQAARASLSLPADGELVAVLPGSRASEIQYIAPRFLAATARLAAQRPALRFVLPAVPGEHDRLERMVREAGLADRVQVLRGQSHVALAACDVTLIASGTATLEAALFKRPMVIGYNMNPLSWWLMKPRQLQPWVGLPNILLGEFAVPELLQDQASPQALADAVLDWFAAPEKMAAVQDKFTALHDTLRRDTAQLATDAIQEVLQG